MSSRFRVPRLTNSNIVIRRARNRQERDTADRLVFHNYVAEGYWDNDEKHLTENKWLHSPHRDVFVAVCEHEIVGTVSVIRDSAMGLPSDDFQPTWLNRFRRAGDQLAEGSAFAVRTDRAGLKNLHFYLLACYLQHSFYHTHIDRLVQACRPSHADFYANLLRFEKIGGIVHNSYARRPSQLLSIDLIDAHQVLSDHYESNGISEHSFYRFLLVHEHPLIQLGHPGTRCRSRRRDWAIFARLRQTTAATTQEAESGARWQLAVSVAVGT